MIFITVNDDFYENLNEDDKKALKQLGLQTAFEDSFRKAYIAVIENGTVIHEDISDRQLTYSGKTRCGNTYSLTSASWLIGANAQININNTEYALNKRGFNIVVFDDELNMVLDSVVFDTAGKEHIASRGTRPANEYLREYESYIIEQGKELFLTKGG